MSLYDWEFTERNSGSKELVRQTGYGPTEVFQVVTSEFGGTQGILWFQHSDGASVDARD